MGETIFFFPKGDEKAIASQPFGSCYAGKLFLITSRSNNCDFSLTK